MVSDAGSSRSSRPMIDRGVALPSVKVFSPAREHPLRTRFANSSLRKAEFRKANFDDAARGQLCDRNVRDDFTQPSNSPDHGIKPVWRAINGAVPFPAECHHPGFQLLEAATMQHAALLIQKADRLGPHCLTARCRDLLDSYHVRVAPAALVHAFGGLLDHFGCHIATEVYFDHDIVGVEVVMAAHHRLAPYRRAAARGPISQHREPAVVE